MRRICAGTLAPCVALLLISPPASVAADDSFPIMGQSLGGHWRDAASADADLMGTLPPGRAVPILGRSDATYNGYHWFEIEVGRIIGYQWGGILCSNDRQIVGLAAQCDPADLTAVGAGAGGLTSIQGQYREGRGDITGGDQDRCEGWRPQVTPSYLSIDASESQMSFYLYECDIKSTEPLGTGLRIRGQCALNGTGKAELPALTDADRVLDVLAFSKDNGNTLLLVDQTGPDRGYISSYMLCNR
ncbi:MAG: hypothetical protein AAGC86_17040 [Pseudomonadota bacterium]